MNEERAFAEIMRLIEEELDASSDSRVYTDDAFADRLLEESRRGRSRSELEASRARGRELARAMHRKFCLAAAEARAPRQSSSAYSAPVIGTPARVMEMAKAARCAPVVDQRVAAGEGRDLWDEACDSWVRLPRETPSGEYVALRVNGDSMTPFLASGDTVLIRLGATLAANDVVVVRLPEGGYAVKCADRVDDQRMRLLSFNPEYEPVWVNRSASSVVGTVVARLSSC